jgi:hypothetical protein
MPSPEDYAAKKFASLRSDSRPGPRTEKGKAHSKMNALRHGLSGRIVVLPSEDMGQYLKFASDFVNSLNPATPLESELAQVVADGYWRLKRFRTVEEGMLAMGHYEEAGRLRRRQRRSPRRLVHRATTGEALSPRSRGGAKCHWSGESLPSQLQRVREPLDIRTTNPKRYREVNEATPRSSGRAQSIP